MADKTKKTATTPLCLCGCKDRTKGGRFLPGHDAKLKGTLQRAHRGKGLSAKQKQLVEDLGWEHLVLTNGSSAKDD